MTRVAPRILFDNNFLDRLWERADEARREKVIESARTGAIQYFVSDEVIKETIAIGATKRAAKMSRNAGTILLLAGQNYLATPEGVIASELLGQQKVTRNREDRKSTAALLKQAARNSLKGVDIKRIAKEAREDKERHEKSFKARRAVVLEAVQNLSPGEPLPTLAEVELKNWEHAGALFVRQFCKDYRIPHPDEVAARVMADPTRYPYTRHYARVFELLLFLGSVPTAECRVDRGDREDARQLFYMLALDWLVTDDDKLRLWFLRLFPDSKEVLTLDQLLARV